VRRQVLSAVTVVSATKEFRICEDPNGVDLCLVSFGATLAGSERASGCVPSLGHETFNYSSRLSVQTSADYRPDDDGGDLCDARSAVCK
jgi:hypothetical protein